MKEKEMKISNASFSSLVLSYALVVSFLFTTSHSFHLSTSANNYKFKNSITFLNTPKSQSTVLKASDKDDGSKSKKNIVVISPPGGIGQISAIESVKLGASVYWFIVSNPSSDQKVKLSSNVYNTYKDNIQIAGSTYENAASQSSVDNILSSMTNKIDGLICTMDGIETKDIDEYNSWINAINSISSKISSYSETKVAIASLDDKTFDKKKGFDIGNLFKGDNVNSLEEAIGINNDNTVVFYHGDLFGAPDSSDDSSPFQGGPRRDPILRDEYTMRSIRLDAIPVYNDEEDDDDSSEEVSKLLKLSPRTSRLSIGEASAAYLLSDDTIVDSTKQRQEFLLSSTRGLYPLSSQDWDIEFNKVITTTTPSSSSSLDLDKEILSIEFGSIPSIKRFFDWLETKWAPAILRSYDIAGIRVGERPVSTVRVQEDIFNIVFQTLDTKTYESATIGKLIISLDQSTDNPTIIVKREITDADFLESITNGNKKRKNKKNIFQGEDVLLRSLEDASNQAIEKRLATKITATVQEEAVAPQQLTPPPQPVVAQTTSSSAAPQTGPKSKGARRSLERSRGSTTSRSSKGRKKKQQTTSNTIDDKDAFQ